MTTDRAEIFTVCRGRQKTLERCPIDFFYAAVIEILEFKVLRDDGSLKVLRSG